MHSNGVESWLRAHPDVGSTRITTLVMDYLSETVASLDAVVAAHVWRAESVAEQIDLDRLLLSYKTSAMARAASIEPGHRLTETALRVGLVGEAKDYLIAVGDGETPGNLVVVESVIQVAMGIDLPTSMLGTLRSALSAALSACVRLGRLGAMDAQTCLIVATDDLVDLATKAMEAPIDEIAGNAFELDTLAMRHRLHSPRLFAT